VGARPAGGGPHPAGAPRDRRGRRHRPPAADRHPDRRGTLAAAARRRGLRHAPPARTRAVGSRPPARGAEGGGCPAPRAVAVGPASVHLQRAARGTGDRPRPMTEVSSIPAPLVHRGRTAPPGTSGIVWSPTLPDAHTS